MVKGEKLAADFNKNSWNLLLKPTSVFTKAIQLSPRYTTDYN